MIEDVRIFNDEVAFLLTSMSLLVVIEKQCN